MIINKKQAITEILDRVRTEISISEAIGRDMYLKRAGVSHKGLCPFHNDKSIGSFVVTDGKQIFKCFSCGTGGDVIKYFSLRKGINYVESGLELARDYGIITYDEYEDLTSRKLSDRDSKQIERIYIEKDNERNKSEKADDETLHKVYSLFIKGSTYLGKNVLSQEHLNHLLNERHLTEEEIAETGYFTFPNRYIMKHFLNDLEENDIDVNVLATIPGFFFDKKRNVWSFTTFTGGGIGIPMVNEKGLIHGIQVRKDVVKEGDQRYTWFSSSFAMVKPDLDFGVSSGSPITVIIPKQIKTKTIFVTEGHFKAKKLAKEYNSIAISVQGVCAWANVVKMINKIKDQYKELELNYVYVAYDGDMSYNTAVFHQAIKMGLTLYGINPNAKKDEIIKVLKDENFNPQNKVCFCMWDDELGKGVDDLIFNGKSHKLDKIDICDLYELHDLYLAQLKEIYVDGVNYQDINDISKQERKSLFDSLILSTLPKYKNL